MMYENNQAQRLPDFYWCSWSQRRTTETVKYRQIVSDPSYSPLLEVVTESILKRKSIWRINQKVEIHSNLYRLYLISRQIMRI